MRLRPPLDLATSGQVEAELQAGRLFWNFEELLTDLYDLSGMPGCWQRFLTRVCTDLHASNGVIVRHDDSHDVERLVTAHMQDDVAHLRLKEACDKRNTGNRRNLPILPRLANGKTGHTVFSSDLQSPNGDCLLRSLGVRHLLQAHDGGDGREAISLAIGRTADQAPFDEVETARFARIVPYFEWAAQLADLFAKMTASVKASTAVLDLLPTGVVILDEQGLCVTMNRAAKEALDPDGATLRFIKRNLPKTAAGEQNREDPAAGPQVLTLPSNAPGQRSIAVLWDIPDDRPDQQRKLAFIMDPDHKPNMEIDVAALERIYGLTVTEARVAALVAENNSVAEIAERMGTTDHTVRTHLRHIFEKTGTERQVDLVHLLLQSPLALRLPRRRAAAKASQEPLPDKPLLIHH